MAGTTAAAKNDAMTDAMEFALPVDGVPVCVTSSNDPAAVLLMWYDMHTHSVPFVEPFRPNWPVVPPAGSHDSEKVIVADLVPVKRKPAIARSVPAVSAADGVIGFAPDAAASFTWSTGEVVAAPDHSVSWALMDDALVDVNVGAVSPAPQFGLYQIAVLLSELGAARAHPDDVDATTPPLLPTMTTATSKLPAVVACPNAGVTVAAATTDRAPALPTSAIAI